MISVVVCVCLIVCHAGPADHFAAFAQFLKEHGHQVNIYACGAGLKRLEERGVKEVHPFSIDQLSLQEQETLAGQLAQRCSGAALVLTDVGDPFDLSLQKAFGKLTPHVRRYAYYDNPEPYVAGGYSSVAADVMGAAQKVLFANSCLVHQPIYREADQEMILESERRLGVGYYPLERAQSVAWRREKEYPQMRLKLLEQEKSAKKVGVYFGGNNEAYFEEGFPEFLKLLESAQEDLSDWLILIQQHPGARKENRDGKRVCEWIENQKRNLHAPKVVLSQFDQEQVQIGSDAIFYYQTSLAAQFALLGVSLFQVGCTAYPDFLMRNGWAVCISSAQELADYLKGRGSLQKASLEAIACQLGVRSDWKERLLKIVKEESTLLNE